MKSKQQINLKKISFNLSRILFLVPRPTTLKVELHAKVQSYSYRPNFSLNIKAYKQLSPDSAQMVIKCHYITSAEITMKGVMSN